MSQAACRLPDCRGPVRVAASSRAIARMTVVARQVESRTQASIALAVATSAAVKRVRSYDIVIRWLSCCPNPCMNLP